MENEQAAAAAAQTIEPSEAAARRVLGYPAEGPIEVAGRYPDGRGYVRIGFAACTHEQAGPVHDFQMMIMHTWVGMLNATGTPIEGPNTVFRCPCAEAAVRVYLIGQMYSATATEGDRVPESLERKAAEYGYRLDDGAHRWEREIAEQVGRHFPALALAEATGLRVPRSGPGLDDAARRIVDHARTCRLPFPLNIVARLTTLDEAGDVS